ncbi:MAG: lysophospholipid acyltransferase family protein [Alphaproteobacteria bacterium]|nr:lysophospholipid acyltransferase family protein [Alphaproteobacteria bacterium]
MELISKKEILKKMPVLKKTGGDLLLQAAFRLLDFDKVNAIYSKNYHLPRREFLDEVIRETGVQIRISASDVEKIPPNHGFITVSNHPYGGIDGLLLAKIVSEVNPGYKLLVNFLLNRIEPIQSYFLGVNPFETRKDVQSSFGGLKEALLHLQQGNPLGIFPSGEVSSFGEKGVRIMDPDWQFTIIKFIKRARVPIVPIYFSGHNSLIFNFLGIIHPRLRTLRLPAELFNKKDHIIEIRIGSPILVREQDEFREIIEFGKMLRMKTYSLGASARGTCPFRTPPPVKPTTLIPSVEKNLIQKEINEIPPEYFLFKLQGNRIFCVPSKIIPNIMVEISRLRELTYRDIGEGTNNKSDQDTYDAYFEQLFIWDDESQKIVGGYRIGRGDEIMDRFGIEGHYINSLFKIKKEFGPVLRISLELGRSFIVKEYQKKVLSLFLLWKGILYVLLREPRYRYLIGPVSIPNEFSDISKGLVVRFLKANNYNSEYGAYIKPRNSFKDRIPGTIDLPVFLRYTHKDVNRLDRFIHDIDPKFKLPILLKKYLSVNSEVLGFNIDPLFNNCLDALIMLDLFEVPVDKIEALSKEIHDQTIMNRFRKES